MVTLTLMPPDLSLSNPPTRVATLLVDSGFSDELQIDWETLEALGLLQYTQCTITSQLADGSSVTDIVALVRIVIANCGIDLTVRCLSNSAYDQDLRLVGSRLLRQCRAVIDYDLQQSTFSS